MTSPAVKLRNLSFCYTPGIEVLKTLSFDIAPGERVALIGHNGSGKTTLARHLNGLLRPDTGRVWIQGTDTATLTTTALAGETALLFQHPDDQICKRTVWEEVGFGPYNLGYSKLRTDRLVAGALEIFGLAPFARENPHDLGYSERKRLALASVLAMDTPVLVLDEPTAGLDPCEVSLLKTAMADMTQKGKTIVVITHDMNFAAENIPRAICLQAGQKVFDGRLKDLFANTPLMEESRLLPPETVRLGRALGIDGPALTPRELIDAAFG